MRFKLCQLSVLLAGVLAVSGCSTTGDFSIPGISRQDSSQTSASKTPPGMNDKGEVIDSSKVEAGHGQKVKGLNNWEGEITGKPAPGSKFTQLQIGMSMRAVTSRIGEPDDEGSYMTGKAWIPFYYGSDRYRYELVYKGQGRLIFAGGAVGRDANANLIWIIHNKNEPGIR